jgi:hypothetical protein
MSTLAAIGYNKPCKAEEDSLTLCKLQRDCLIDLEDAIVAVKYAKDKVKPYQSFNLSDTGAVRGGLWRTLIGMIFLNPLIVLLLVLALSVSSCTPDKPVAEAEYSAKIVGNWLGTVEDMKESITFSGDGSFNAQLRPQGFISNTLSQDATGTISGSWVINGRTITLQITSAEDVRVKNLATSSTILTFNQDEISLKSDQGEISTFTRATSL